MTIFGWIAAQPEPPGQLDLRRQGWSMCCSAREHMASCPSVLIVDGSGLNGAALRTRVLENAPVGRLLVIGVEDETQRASLLELGCGDVLPTATVLDEVQARARRVAERIDMMPRRRLVGPLTLDLMRRDARHGRRWLRLHPREFEVLWRLADQPGRAVTRKDLLRDVWRISQEPETNSVEVHVSRLRTKLAGVGCAGLVVTVPEGGYRLVERPHSVARITDPV